MQSRDTTFISHNFHEKAKLVTGIFKGFHITILFNTKLKNISKKEMPEVRALTVYATWVYILLRITQV